MEAFARENPFITFFIIIAVLATLRALIPWSRRDRPDDDGED